MLILQGFYFVFLVRWQQPPMLLLKIHFISSMGKMKWKCEKGIFNRKKHWENILQLVPAKIYWWRGREIVQSWFSVSRKLFEKRKMNMCLCRRWRWCWHDQSGKIIIQQSKAKHMTCVLFFSFFLLSTPLSCHTFRAERTHFRVNCMENKHIYGKHSSDGSNEPCIIFIVEKISTRARAELKVRTNRWKRE